MANQVYRTHRSWRLAVIAYLALAGWNLGKAQEPRTIQGKHVRLILGQTPQTASPGGQIKLLIDVALQPGLHVYAPGVADYIPIAWTMKPSAAATVQPVTFPPSRKLHLPAIDETVPAYEGEIHLTRTVIVDKNAKGDLTLEGALRYQACDDRLCYIPETLKVKWIIPVRHK